MIALVILLSDHNIARLEAGVTTQLHALTGITKTYVVITGTGTREVGSEAFEIGAGDQVMVPAGVAQRITALGEANLRFYCLCVPRFVPGAYVNLEQS